jgi:hypothetical protein
MCGASIFFAPIMPLCEREYLYKFPKRGDSIKVLTFGVFCNIIKSWEKYNEESECMKKCKKCGAVLEIEENTAKENLCTNQFCEWHKRKFIYPDDARFCDVCGSPTVYAKQ